MYKRQIIRQGKYIDTVKVSDVNENDLAAMMVGRKVEFKVEKKDIKPGEVVLEVKDIHGKDYRGVEILKGLNLSVRRGEIVGLAGVDGNGQTELVEILTGLKKVRLKYQIRYTDGTSILHGILKIRMNIITRQREQIIFWSLRKTIVNCQNIKRERQMMFV